MNNDLEILNVNKKKSDEAEITTESQSSDNIQYHIFLLMSLILERTVHGIYCILNIEQYSLAGCSIQ